MINLNEKFPFNGKNTFNCGQCFRWTEEADGSFVGIASGHVCRVKDGMVICGPEEERFWAAYFALDIPYDVITRDLITKDPHIESCIAFGQGMRILRQDLWETMVSFIISANNHIPRIRNIVEMLCSTYGQPLEFEGKVYHSFPSAKELVHLQKEDLQVLHAGYRDVYLLDAIRKVAHGEIVLEQIQEMETAAARQELMRIKGIGKKVADCILLFALGRYEVFPQDVWIKRILKDVYAVEGNAAQAFITQTYGEYGGFAQQYLFHFYRNHR